MEVFYQFASNSKIRDKEKKALYNMYAFANLYNLHGISNIDLEFIEIAHGVEFFLCFIVGFRAKPMSDLPIS